MYLCSYTHNEAIAYGNGRLHLLRFDKRHDFLIDSEFAGIAVKISLINTRHFTTADRGVRRKVVFTLIDATDRCEIKSITVRLNMPQANPYKDLFVAFDHDDVAFVHNHSYKIIVKDSTSNDIIHSMVFHTYGIEELGHPVDWYEPLAGGLSRDFLHNTIYRSVDVAPHTRLYSRFYCNHMFGKNMPTILPELEVRIHRPYDENVDVEFIEPYLYDERETLCRIDKSFIPHIHNRQAFYVELLCMEYPIAGFVFSTTGPDIEGNWMNAALEPLDEYSEDKAEERFKQMAYITTEPATPASEEENANEADESDNECQTASDNSSDDDFDRLLQQFIDSQLNDSADTDPGTGADDETATTDDEESDETPQEHMSILSDLEDLTGLRSVKEKLDRYEKLVMFNKMRSDSGLPVADLPLHAMFLGSPGTGKTTVAKRMGAMLQQAGLLSRGHIVVRERATLLGQNYSSESENTLKALEEASGGILFIDEAYQLFQPNDPRDPGKFVIETLLTALADKDNRDWMLILAGYPEKMKSMFELNPGFKSRIPESNIYTFDDLAEDELMEIALNYLNRNNYSLSPEAHEALSARLASDYANRDVTFGNARHVINMIQTDIIPSMAIRVLGSGVVNPAALSVIEASDIPAPVAVAVSSRTPIGFCA